jgi:hypothetical protein
MLVRRELATRRPRSLARLGLDFVLFSAVVIAVPVLRLARVFARRR